MKKHSEATQTLRAGCSKADPQRKKHTNRQGRLLCTAQLSVQCKYWKETWLLDWFIVMFDNFTSLDKIADIAELIITQNETESLPLVWPSFASTTPPPDGTGPGQEIGDICMCTFPHLTSSWYWQVTDIWVEWMVSIRDVRKPNFGSVSVYKNPNRTEPKPKCQIRNFGFRGFSPNRICFIHIVNI